MRDLRTVAKQILELLKVAAARGRHGPAVVQQLLNRGRLGRGMSDAGEDRKRFFKQLLKAEFMIVGAGIISIDGEVELPLPQFVDHRQQLTFHDTHLHQRVLLMKTTNHRGHQRARHAGSKTNIDLPGQRPLALQQIFLRRPQLLKNQTGVLIKTFAILG